MEQNSMTEEGDYVRVTLGGSQTAEQICALLLDAARLCPHKALSGVVCTIAASIRHAAGGIYLGMRELAELWSGGAHRLAFVCRAGDCRIDCEYAVLMAKHRRVQAGLFAAESEAIEWVCGPSAEPRLAAI
jgi:hypothetical protein